MPERNAEICQAMADSQLFRTRFLFSANAAEDDAVETAIMNVENVLFHRSSGVIRIFAQVRTVWKRIRRMHPASVPAKNFPPAARELKSLDAMILKRLPNKNT